MAAEALSKKEIRKLISNRRSSLSQKEITDKSLAIEEKLMTIKELSRAKRVCIYASLNNEVMTDRIILRLLLMGKEVYAPVAYAEGSMVFYRIFSTKELVPGYMGIREPVTCDIYELKPESMTADDVVIMPLLAFDNTLNRCGYGKGFYDRFLSSCYKPLRIGLAYELQKVEAIAVNELDIPMNKVITEDNIYE